MEQRATSARPGRTFCFVLLFSLLAAARALAQIPPSLMTAERPGVSVLAPAQSFPLAPDVAGGLVPERALDAIDDDPLVSRQDEPPRVDSTDLLYRRWDDGIEAGRNPGAWARLSAASGPSLRLGSAGAAPRWLAGVGNVTRQEEGLASVSVGQVTDRGPFWGPAPRLGGVQLARLPTETSRGTLLPGAFGMTTALGFAALQEMSDPTPSSRLGFGSPMGTGSFLFGLTPDLTIESRMMARPDAASAGFGGTYALSDWGTMRLSATQIQEGDAPVLSSGLGMQVRWEDHALESTYQSLRSGGATTDQRIGVSHQWAVTPQFRLQMGADRDLASGGYALRLQMSVPIDAIGTFWRR